MPIYDYQCKSCEQTATVSNRLHDQVKVPTCPDCKQEMIRDYKFGSIAFNGKGFYSTDK